MRGNKKNQDGEVVMVVGNMNKYVDDDESNFVQRWMNNMNLIPGIERKAV